jgi:hypothetical protein
MKDVRVQNKHSSFFSHAALWKLSEHEKSKADSIMGQTLGTKDIAYMSTAAFIRASTLISSLASES